MDKTWVSMYITCNGQGLDYVPYRWDGLFWSCYEDWGYLMGTEARRGQATIGNGTGPMSWFLHPVFVRRMQWVALCAKIRLFSSFIHFIVNKQPKFKEILTFLLMSQSPKRVLGMAVPWSFMYLFQLDITKR